MSGYLFRKVTRTDNVWGERLSTKPIWHIVKRAAKRAGIDRVAPHHLRRSCAKFCHMAGGELEQIQFLLGHVSMQTTEQHLGCKQKLRAPSITGSDLRTSDHVRRFRRARRLLELIARRRSTTDLAQP